MYVRIFALNNNMFVDTKHPKLFSFDKSFFQFLTFQVFS